MIEVSKFGITNTSIRTQKNGVTIIDHILLINCKKYNLVIHLKNKEIINEVLTLIRD